MGGAMGILSYFASGNLYNDALGNLFYAPMQVFDQTPVGRIMGIFGKDVGVPARRRDQQCLNILVLSFTLDRHDRQSAGRLLSHGPDDGSICHRQRCHYHRVSILS